THNSSASYKSLAKTATAIYTLSLHDALPISSISPIKIMTRDPARRCSSSRRRPNQPARNLQMSLAKTLPRRSSTMLESATPPSRSEEHTSELQSRRDLVCRLLLEKKNNHRKA